MTERYETTKSAINLKYARDCVATFEAYHRGEIDYKEFMRQVDKLKPEGTQGTRKPESILPRPLLPDTEPLK